MRQFKLINSLGAEFDLMRRDAWLHDPQGLGFGRDSEVQRVGDTFALLHTEQAQPAPTGEMMFAGYAQADEFRAFITEGEIVLGYKPLNTWRYLDVVVSMDQGEIDAHSHLLRCAVDFVGTSQWYEQVLVRKAQQSTGTGKRYSYTYPYTYVESETGSVQIHNGALHSYPRLTIQGPVLNPSWTLYVSGKKAADGKLLRRIDAQHKLVVDCSPDRMELAEYTLNGELVASRYADSDFTTQRFFQVPPGDSTINFAHEETAPVTAWVEVRRRV